MDSSQLNKKIKRFKTLRSDIVKNPPTGIYTIVLKHVKTGTYAKALQNLKIIDNTSGLWFWIGGDVTEDLVKKISDEEKKIRRWNSNGNSDKKTKKIKKRKYTRKSNVKSIEVDPYNDLAKEASEMIKDTVRGELEPILISLQCIQRHLDVIATKININLS